MTASALRLPPGLGAGDRIAVVAPGSPVEHAALEAGLDAIRSMGFDPVPGRSVRRRRGELAGTDAERAADLAWALHDPEIRGVWFARGGYGVTRILGEVDFERLARSPRLLLGFSDLTALFAPVVRRARIPVYYGPVVADLARPGRVHRASLEQALAHPRAPVTHRLPARGVLRAGRARGTMVGGCLSLLQALVGTPYEPDYRGAVLFIEEVGEAAYRIDRMLTHLRAAGRLDQVSAVLVGQMVACAPHRRGGRPLRQVLREALGDLGVPVATGLAAGHGPRALTLPLGFTATVDTARRTLRLAPPTGSR